MGNQPKEKFVAGSVSATIWENEIEKDGKKQSFFTISMQRSYKEGEEWKNTSTLRVNDLPKAKVVLSKAYEYLVMRTKEE